MKGQLYNLTNPQKSIWLTENYYQGTNINNVCGTLTISEPVDFNLLKKAIQLFVENNAIYRTQFVSTKDTAMQYITDFVPFEIEKVFVNSDSEVKQIAEKEASTPFSLLDHLLFRFTLYEFPDGHGGFIINNHHIISDSWTLGILGNEIVSYYSSFKKGETPSFKQIEDCSYTNYISAEEEYKKSAKQEKDKAYWNEVFKTVPEIASIPSTNENLVVESSSSIRAQRKEFSFDEKLLEQLNQYCSSHKISLFNFLMAVYAIYLGRVSNLEDFCIGTPILNRTNFKEKQTCGMFINTLPLRFQLDSNLSFLNFLDTVSQNSMSLLRHQKYGYQAILEDLRKSDYALPSLYTMMISYQITKITDKQEETPHTSEWIFDGVIADDIDVHLLDLNNSHSMTIVYDYKLAKFQAEDIEDIHSRILNMISQILEQENILLKQIEIVTPSQKKQLLVDFNNTKMSYPREKTIIELFEEQVKNHPTDIALVFGEDSLTYEELNKKVNQLAHFIKFNYQIKPGDIIGLFIDKSLEMVIAMFAVLKTGATFLPLDFELPTDRLSYILSNSSPNLILTSHLLSEAAKKLNINYLAVDLDSSFIYGNLANCANLPVETTPEDLIYVMYTSGSTGTPKGVMVKQRNIVRLVKNPNFLSFKDHEVMVQTGTIVFDACIFEIFGSLLNGFKLYVLKKDQILDPLFMKQFIPEKKVTILFLTTGLLNQLCNEDPEIFASLRYLLTGGDAISSKHIATIKNTCPNTQIINCYGPTENGSYSTCYPLKNHDMKSVIPIGKPISNSTCYIVSSCGTLQPIGVPGELWVGGDGVARGYLNNTELTNERFIANPFDEGMLYQTGDFVKWGKDGNILFMSRMDKQIKLRGFRIELEDIDANILKFLGIKQSLSMLIEVNQQKAICSYIIGDETISISDLRTFLANCLPAYMIPTYIMQLDALPLTISGKLDRKALPIPSSNSQSEVVPTRNKIDSCIKEKIVSLLSIENISIDDSFFNIGGDSLSAISLATYLTNQYSISISVKTIFHSPTIRELSDYISSQLQNSRIAPEIESVQTIENEYPVSSCQRRIYYVASSAPKSLLYNISGSLLFETLPDIKKLENCLAQLIQRHDSLRTSFVISNGDLVQKIEKQMAFTLEVEEQNNPCVSELLKDFVKPFDLSKAPLFRAKLILTANKKAFLLMDMHHTICDGASFTVFIKELCDLYNGKELLEKSIDYKDYVLWEKSQVSTTAFEQSENFWLTQFQDEIPVLEMPTTFSRPAKPTYHGDNYCFTFNTEFSNKIIEIAKKNGLTPYMLLLAAYYVLLFKYSGNENIVVGTPIVGRPTEELQSIIGMFVNSLPLKRFVDSHISFSEFMNQLKEYCLDVFEHQDYPFEELVKKLDLKRDMSRNPIFDTMFIYQNNGYPRLDFGDTKASYETPNLGISKFDFSLEIVPIDSQFHLRVEYATDLFDNNFIKNFGNHYQSLLENLLNDLNQTIGDVALISSEEKNIILQQFNNTTVSYPREKNIITLWEEQVRKTPNNMAIFFEGQTMTYHELDEKSNQLAHFLQSHSVNQGDVVPILLDKSLEMIVSILAILKVGAAFLPIDVQYPKERIDYILRDSMANVLLTVSEFMYKVTTGIQALSIELENEFYHWQSKEPIVQNYSPDSLAYIMYTSGSTGKPKGVMIQHRNIIRLVQNNKFINFEQEERILQTGSIVFDACTFEIWGALLNGFELYIIKKEELLDPSLLQDYLIKYKITILWLTAPLFNQLCEDNPHMFRTVRVLLTGGDVLSPKHINLVRAANPNLTIINGYGPTENTTFSTCFTINQTYLNTIPIGKPISNSTCYIVSTSGQLQPVGIPGELWVGGDGVGIGYWNNQELTTQRFINNPFNDGKVYKTGDLVKWRDDGTIDFLGRIDNQVKIRGFRVELGEINLHISDFSGINECITVINTIQEEKAICTYFVADHKINLSDLKTHLKKFLPDYMIPSYFMQLSKLPINTNGKVDRTALPLDFNKEKFHKESIVLPRNEKEELLLSLFKKILNDDDLGVTDDFFEFGGDSLTAMKLQVEAISNGIPISYGDIFEFYTVEKLVAHLANSSKVEDTKTLKDTYSKYDKLLCKNKTEDIVNLSYASMGNVLLTGFTGFLGAHVLDSFIKQETGNIYCLIRGKNNLSAEERLKNVLHFYFEDRYDSFIGNRIQLIEGDITRPLLGLSNEDYTKLGSSLTTVIHCAALVKHFGDYHDFKEININGTQRIVDFCEKFNLKMLHVSTISVSGNNLAEGANIDNHLGKDILFGETNFYVGQNLKNPYIHSKFEAERIVLDAISRGVSACILRMGNLTSRFSEGKFQQNHFENAFVNRIRSFLQIGYIPDYMLNLYAEFTPIDYCGDAIIKIATHFNSDYTIFHLLNEKHVDLDKLYTTMTQLGVPMELVSGEEFNTILSQLLQDPEKKTYLEGIINDLDKDKNLVYESEVKIESDFTKEFLEKIGFSWPVINQHYLRNYFKYLADIGYFNIHID